jgi:L-arabinose isomerase
MIFADGEMIELPEKMQNFDHAISGWFKPNTELATFLEKFSELGGTHHSAMVYGVSAKELQAFAKALNINSFII